MAKKTEKEVRQALEVPEYKPTITLDEKLYPDLENLKVDQEIELKIKVKITNISRFQYSPKKTLHVSGTIENAKGEDYGDEADD